jgi:fission process protein 1
MLAAHRYVAYTSDIGESFRPIAHPYLIKGAYGVSWLYIGGDVFHEGYKAYVRNQKVLHPEKRDAQDEVELEQKGKVPVPSIVSPIAGKESGKAEGGLPGKVPAIDDYRAVMAQRAVFQSVASMGLPAFTIHSIVRYSGRAMKNVKNVKLRTWGPIGVSICLT